MKRLLFTLVCFLTVLVTVACGGEQTPEATPPEAKSFDATLMSFNIRTDSYADERESAMLSFLLDRDPEIVCMQEIQKNIYDYMKPRLSMQYEMIWYSRAPKAKDAEGLAILYDKSKWTLLEADYFWLSETPEEESKGWDAGYYRICVTAVLQHKKTGVLLNVFNTHLDLTATTQRNGLELILSRMAEVEGYVYLCGDFNFFESSPLYSIPSEVLLDCRRAAPDSDEGRTYNAFGDQAAIEARPDEPIDYCFVSPEGIEPLTFEICRDKYGKNGDKYLSDHYPIMTKVRFYYTPEE